MNTFNSQIQKDSQARLFESVFGRAVCLLCKKHYQSITLSQPVLAAEIRRELSLSCSFTKLQTKFFLQILQAAELCQNRKGRLYFSPSLLDHAPHLVVVTEDTTPPAPGLRPAGRSGGLRSSRCSS